MNATTTTNMEAIPTTTMSIYDLLYMYFKNPVIVIRFYQIGYSFTFFLGFIGTTASLLTFSRPTLRKVSTGCLFITLAVSDMLYLLTCIFDYLEFGIQISFYRHVEYNELCRYRTFVTNVTQVASAWILVIVSIDRWIRTRFPFKSGSLCTPKKALIAVAVLLVIDIGLHSHLLTPMFGMLIPGFAIAACGPNLFSPSYFNFYFLQWSIVQIFTTCLIPASLMLVIITDIFINVRLRKRAVVQPNQVWQNDPNMKRQKNLQNQMFILLFASVCIFFVTSLPVSIYKIMSPRQGNISTAVYQIVSIWTALGWFQSLFFSIGFYIHCLTSTLFRKEFQQQMQCLWRQNQTQVSNITVTRIDHRVQNHRIKKH